MSIHICRLWFVWTKYCHMQRDKNFCLIRRLFPRGKAYYPTVKPGNESMYWILIYRLQITYYIKNTQHKLPWFKIIKNWNSQCTKNIQK